MLLLECEGLRDLGGCQVVGDHAVVVEVLPLLVGEVENFRYSYRQRHHQSVRQVTTTSSYGSNLINS